MSAGARPGGKTSPWGGLVRALGIRVARRAALVLLLVVALAVLLFGEGLGWFPGNEPSGAAAVHQVEGPRGNSTADAVPQTASPAGETAGARDQQLVLLGVVRNAAALGSHGDGFAAARRLRATGLSAPLRDELSRAEQALELELLRELAHARELLRLGRVHSARAALDVLLAGTDPDVVRILREDCSRNGLPDLASAEPLPGPEVVPMPLPRGRAVVVVRGGTESRTIVADADPTVVTVRLQRPEGVSWPRVPVTQLELPDPRAPEALAMAEAAVLAGDPVLARLWLACCVQVPGGVELARRLLGR